MSEDNDMRRRRVRDLLQGNAVASSEDVAASVGDVADAFRAGQLTEREALDLVSYLVSQIEESLGHARGAEPEG